MENIHKRFFDSLIEAEKRWQNADHMVFVTYRVVKDSKLLTRALESVYNSVVLSVSTILKYEYFHKRISLSQNTGKNLDLFFRKCAEKYGLNARDREVINDLIIIGRKHKESGFEFSKRNKIIILDDNLGMSELSVDRIKEFLEVGKRIIIKARENFGLSR